MPAVRLIGPNNEQLGVVPTQRALAHAQDLGYDLVEIAPNSTPPVARILGRVTIGGVQRPIAVTASVRADSLGAMHVQGTYVIQMRDFAVAAPRRFGGLLRVRDQITVHFDVVPDANDGAIDRIRCSLVQPIHAALMLGATYGKHS